MLCLFAIVFFIACKEDSSIKLSFVDEFVLKDSIRFKNTLVGGLSSIDYNNGDYYMVIDDDKNPRVLKAAINFKKDTIQNVVFKDVVCLSDSIPFFKNNILDLESAFIDENNDIIITSEGSIKKGKNPTVFSVNKKGEFVSSYTVSEYFKAESYGKPRHNALFEASTKAYKENGFWIGMEGVLEIDGEAPSQKKQTPPARITYYDAITKEPTYQFAYPLDYIERPSKGGFNVNGITAILAYAKDSFLVVERAFQSGYGINGNVVKIYNVVLDAIITNTLNIKSLKTTDYVPVKKQLVFDFNSIRNKLTDKIIDNIEGITLGPVLENGKQSLILVADDNFQKHGKQLNQIIVLALENKI